MKPCLTMLSVVLASALAIPSLPARADDSNSGKGGGDGLKVGDKIYPLDLVEVGAESDPYLDPGSALDPQVKAGIERSLDPELFPTDLIAQKLSDIARLDVVAALALEATITSFNWNLVNRSLIDVKDEEDTNTHFDPRDLVQLAVRKNRAILIDRGHWQALSTGSRVALVFHEAIYAALDQRSSQKAREITGYLFTRNFGRKGAAGLASVMTGTFGRDFYKTAALKTYANAQAAGLPVVISRTDSSITLATQSLLLFGSTWVDLYLEMRGRLNPQWEPVIARGCQEGFKLGRDMSVGSLVFETVASVGAYQEKTDALHLDYIYKEGNFSRNLGKFATAQECVTQVLRAADEIAAQVYAQPPVQP